KAADPLFGRAASTLSALANAKPRLPLSRRALALAAAGTVALGFCIERLWQHHAGAPPPAPVPVEAPAPTPPPPAKVLPTGTKSAQSDPDVTLEDAVVQPDPGELELHASVDSVNDDRAFVHLETTPPGTAVVLDDRTLGTTPVSLRFKVGVPFAVQFQHDGYKTQTRWLTVNGAD